MGTGVSLTPWAPIRPDETNLRFLSSRQVRNEFERGLLFSLGKRKPVGVHARSARI